MSGRSAIEWTHTVQPDGTVTRGSTWNPIRGTLGRHTCVKVSTGCEHCYAERMTMRFGGPAYKVGADTARLDAQAIQQPLGWKQGRKIFVCSMTDLFGEWVPDEWIDQIVNVMWATPQHTYQVLTKRAQRMHDYWWRWQSTEIDGETRRLPDNLWLGVTAENQQYADERIPILLDIPAAVRFVSAEPLLGQIDLSAWLPYYTVHPQGPKSPEVEAAMGEMFKATVRHMGGLPLHWVIGGGESGGPADRRLVTHLGDQMSGEIWTPRPDRLPWVRTLRDQCTAVGVAWFWKQWGGPTPKSGGRLLDGREWSEFPYVAHA